MNNQLCWNLIRHHKFLALAKDCSMYIRLISMEGKEVWSGNKTSLLHEGAAVSHIQEFHWLYGYVMTTL